MCRRRRRRSSIKAPFKRSMPSGQGRSIYGAARLGNLEAIKVLLRQGAPVSELYNGVTEGKTRIFKEHGVVRFDALRKLHSTWHAAKKVCT